MPFSSWHKESTWQGKAAFLGRIALLLAFAALPVKGAFVPLPLVIGIVLASAFPAIIVYAQDMMPYRIGMVSGMFYGLSFGLGGVGAAVLGVVADHYGIVFVYQICAFLPLLGLLAVFLPDVRPPEDESLPSPGST